MQTYSSPYNKPVTTRKPSHNSYSEALDLLANLSCARSEDEAIREIIHVFGTVFQPQDLIYIAMHDGSAQFVRPMETPKGKIRELIHLASQIQPANQSIDQSTTPVFPIICHGELQGIVSLDFGDIPPPDQHFFNIARLLSLHAGVVVSNLRARQKLKEGDLSAQDTIPISGYTGIMSRRLFFEVAETEFRRAKRYHRPLSAILVDIDDFASLTDAYGSEITGHILTELSQLFNRELRESDIRVRMGGEELLVLLPETTIRYAQMLAERLRRRVTDIPLEVDNAPVPITISQGVAVLDPSMKTLEELINGCDQALTQAKRYGGNQTATWAPPVKEYEPITYVGETDLRIGFY
ncbi:MAG: GGDEF domain-containing protein [Leptolinea sp.]|nr:GGDEF domain-containing protein [Leptolinea sp.]